MAIPSFFEVLLILLMPLLGGGQQFDLLSMVDPQLALETLGEKTDDEAILGLIAGGVGAKAAAGADYDKKEAEKAIQNLASSTESIRTSAREKLAALGPGIRSRLEEVVKNDKRRAEEAQKVLAALESRKAGATRKQTVAKLVAMRLAGMRKLEKAVPAMKAAAASPDLFLAATARQGLAAIVKEASAVAAVVSAPLGPAVEALPKNTRLLLAARTKPASATVEPIKIEKMIRDFAGKMGVPQEELDKGMKEATVKVVQFVLDYGNMSVDGIYLANVGNIGPQGAGLGIVVTGNYERALLEAGLEQNSNSWTISETSGKKVFTSMAARLIPLDAHSLLVLPQQASKNFPLADYLADLAGKKRNLAADARWSKFLETLGGSASIRGLAITDSSLMDEIYKALEGDPETAPIVESVKGMKELELDIASIEDAKLRIRLEGTFVDDEKSTSLIDFLKAQIQNGISEMEAQQAQFDFPPLRTAIEVMKGLRISAEGKKGILRMELDPAFLLGTFGAQVSSPQDP